MATPILDCTARVDFMVLNKRRIYVISAFCLFQPTWQLLCFYLDLYYIHFAVVFIPPLLFNLLIYTTYQRLLFPPIRSFVLHSTLSLSSQSIPIHSFSFLSSYLILYTLILYHPFLPLLDVTMRSGQPSGNAMSFTDPIGIKLNRMKRSTCVR